MTARATPGLAALVLATCAAATAFLVYRSPAMALALDTWPFCN